MEASLSLWMSGEGGGEKTRMASSIRGRFLPSVHEKEGKTGE